MKAKILLGRLIIVLATTTFAAENTAPTNTVSLSDGSKVTFLGITYGKHHVAPNFEAIEGNLKKARSIDRSNDIAVAWLEIEHDPTNFANYQLIVSDKEDVHAVGMREDFKSIYQLRKGVEVEGFELQAYPRWDEQFHLALYSWTPLTYYGELLSTERFLATNPARKDIGNAVAEKLPVTKMDGDLSVTLTNLAGGAPAPPYLRRERIYPVPDHWPEPAPSDPLLQAVRFGFDLKQSGHTTTNWQLASVVITDAVSNYVEANLHFQDIQSANERYAFIKTPADDYKGYVFWPGLWPNEPAWNVRMEFTQTSDFATDEIVTFTNLPVIKAGRKEHRSELPFVTEQSVQGVNLRIDSSEIQPDGKFLNVILYADPDPGTESRLTLMEASDEQGRNFEIPQFQLSFLSGGEGIYSFGLSDPHDIKTLNFKLAVHRSRHFTFTVKPD